MTAVQTPASVPIPEDAALTGLREITTSKGEKVIVHSLELKDVLRVVTAIKKVGVRIIPPELTAIDFVPPEEKTRLRELPEDERGEAVQKLVESLHPGDLVLIQDRIKERAEAIFHWIASSETLAPVLLSAVSNLTEQQAGGLRLPDALNVLAAALDLVDWPSTVQAFMGFFGRIGGLMAEASRQSVTKPAAESEVTQAAV